MTSRERVLAAAAHREPDRIPLFAPNLMRSRTPYDPRVVKFLDEFAFDRLEQVAQTQGHPATQFETGTDEYADGYGCRYRFAGSGLPYCVHSPLAAVESVRDVEQFAWPDVDAIPDSGIGSESDTGARTALKTATAAQGAGRATAVSFPAVFHQCQYLRGFEEWLVDIRQNPALLEAIAERVSHIHLRFALQALEEAGQSTDFVMTGDDFGWSAQPYMSPEDFRRLIKPVYMRLIGEIKSTHPHLRFWLHSHGQIMDLVPDLIDCGVDILNPILPLDNMDLRILKREYGNDLCFHGGVDVEHILPFGTVEEVRDHVRAVIETLSPGGGYWYVVQVISPMVPPENLIAAYETALDWRRG